MTLTEARALVRQWASSNADTVLYSDADVDRAIQAVGDDFVFHTLATRTVDDLDCTADDPDLDLSTLTGFKSERLISVYLTDPSDDAKEYDLLPIAASDMRRLRRESNITTTPTSIALLTDTAARLYPTPDVAYEAHVEWKAPLTSFTPGTATPNDVTLNIADDYLRTILMYGGTAFLQHADPKLRYASESHQKYVEFRTLVKGKAGSRGVRSFTRGESDV